LRTVTVAPGLTDAGVVNPKFLIVITAAAVDVPAEVDVAALEVAALEGWLVAADDELPAALPPEEDEHPARATAKRQAANARRVWALIPVMGSAWRRRPARR
jgi:hypothetical protein